MTIRCRALGPGALCASNVGLRECSRMTPDRSLLFDVHPSIEARLPTVIDRPMADRQVFA
jgi:hypothetical protein